METINFKELPLSPEVAKALDEMGFEEATPIQALAIPRILEGRDIVGQAMTGTGKTCAFGIPAVEKADRAAAHVQVLVLCPTRELAIQVAEEIQEVARYKKGVKVLPIYGGQAIDRQIYALKAKPQIIVGTPGRVMDHMRRKTLRLADLSILVLDEADEMLNMGFREDIDTIVADLPAERQTLLFSATLSPEIREIADAYLRDPASLSAVHKQLTIPQIEQYYLEVRESSKLELLCRLIDAKNIGLGLVFCNTKKKVDELTAALQGRGYSAEALHGDMKQAERDRVMGKFRKGTVDLLVATDVAARGLDVDDIEAVFNYDIPSDEEYYVHRIGRTARAGRKGVSYSFVFGRDFYKIKDIQRYTKSVIHPMQPPTIADIQEARFEESVNQVKEVLAKGGYEKYSTAVERILEGVEDATSFDVASALFQLAFSGQERTYEASELDDPAERYRRDGMVRLFLGVGASDRIEPRNIVQGIASRSSLSGKQLGAIDIRRQFTYVEVPADRAEEVVQALRDFTFHGRRVQVEIASKRERPKSSKGAGDRSGKHPRRR